MSNSQKLAELLGWTRDGRVTWPPNFDIDPAAMHQVYPVLKEKGLWEQFIAVWDNQTWGRTHLDLDKLYESIDLHHFLTDLPGQVRAAITVLEKK